MSEQVYAQLKTKEANAIQMLYAMQEILDETAKTLESRLKVCERYRNHQVMRTWIRNEVVYILSTVEPRKRLMLGANLPTQEVRIVSKYSIDTTPDKVVVPADALRSLIFDGVKNNCDICMGGRDDMRVCEFRRLVRDVTVVDADESGGKCMCKQFKR